MEIETLAAVSTPLSTELEQINREITNAQIAAQQAPQLNFSTTRRLPLSPRTSVPELMLLQPELMQTSLPTQTSQIAANSSTVPSLLLQNSQLLPSSSMPTPIIETSSQTIGSTSSSPYTEPESHASFASIMPVLLIPSSAQSSENIPTTVPSARQPIAQAPQSDDIKTEQPIPEVIDIKEELDESTDEESNDLFLTSNLQNFVPTATPSSLPPSFLERGSNNPLSMVGSMKTGDGPGPSGLNVPILSESMM